MFFLFVIFKLFLLYPSHWDSIVDILFDWTKSRKEDFDMLLVQNCKKIIALIHTINEFEPFYKKASEALSSFTKEKSIKYSLKKLDDIDLPLGLPASWNITSVSPKEVAKHITSYYYKLIVPIISKEMSQTFWSPGSETPMFSAYTSYFENLSYFISFSILCKESNKHAANVYRFWFDVAQNLHELNNLPGASSVMNGILHESVGKLTKIRKLSINKEKNRTLNFLFLNKFYTDISGIIKESNKFQESSRNAPAIPYLILTKREITFISDSNVNFGNELNLKRFSKACQFIEQFRNFLNQKYHFKEHLKITELIYDGIHLDEKMRNHKFLMKMSNSHE